MVENTLATFEKIKCPLHCTSNFFWELKAKKAMLTYIYAIFYGEEEETRCIIESYEERIFFGRDRLRRTAEGELVHCNCKS